jgi:lipoyl(octanoyl) transferase
MDMAYNSMIKEFAEIFQLDLDTSPDCSFQVKKILNQLHYVLFSTQGVCYSRLC